MEFVFLLFLSVPVAAIVFFAVSLTMFILGKIKNKKCPDSVSLDKMLVRKTCFIISSIIVAFFAAIFITVIILFSTVISFM